MLVLIPAQRDEGVSGKSWLLLASVEQCDFAGSYNELDFEVSFRP